MDGSDFLDWPEAWMRGADGSGIPDCPNGVRGSHLAIFPDIGTHSSSLLALNAIEGLTPALVVAAAAVPR